jgi:hypothetical protein
MRRILTATFLLLLLLPAAHALAADTPGALLIDACRDERVDGTYSQRTYKQALDQLPADSDQYTACRDVIDRARLAALKNRNSGRAATTGASTPAGGGGGGSTGGGGTAGTSTQSGPAPAPAAADRSSRSTGRRSHQTTKPRASDQPATTTTQPAAEQPLLPTGPVGNNVSAPATTLPSSVIVLLAALALFPLLAILFIGWNRVHARRAR